jgi:hypothetical protein
MQWLARGAVAAGTVACPGVASLPVRKLPGDLVYLLEAVLAAKVGFRLLKSLVFKALEAIFCLSLDCSTKGFSVILYDKM